MNKKQFRILIAVSLVLLLLSTGFEWFYYDGFLESVNGFIEANEPSSSSVWHLVSGFSLIVGLMLLVISCLAMLLFQNWARYSYIGSYVLMLPAYFYTGVYVSSGLGQFVYDLSSMFSGAIVVIIFYTPVRHFFTETD